MKKFFFLLSLLLLTAPVWSQDYVDEDQYPETDPAALESGEFAQPRSLPPSDYEEVPREEQEYVPEQPVTDEMPPEEIYEADEEYLE